MLQVLHGNAIAAPRVLKYRPRRDSSHRLNALILLLAATSLYVTPPSSQAQSIPVLGLVNTTTPPAAGGSAVVFHNGANGIATGVYRWDGSNWNAASDVFLNITTPLASSASGAGAAAIGPGANASGANSVALGSLSAATGQRAISIGAESLALDWSVALGSKAHADKYAVSVGPNTVAHDNSIAIGSSATALTQNANAGTIALGTGASAQGFNNGGAIAIGTNAKAISQAGGSGTGNGITAIAIGDQAASYVSAVAIGYSAQGSGGGGVAIGYKADTFPTVAGSSSAIAIGDRATAKGTNAIAIGGNANATGTTAAGEASVAIGAGASAVKKGAVALGGLGGGVGGASASEEYAFAAGAAARASGKGAVAIGGGEDSVSRVYADALGDNAIAIGTGAKAAAANALAFGQGAQAALSDTFAMGTQAQATGAQSFAIGSKASASGTGAMAIGVNTVASTDNTVALGNGSRAIASGGIALGALSIADRDASTGTTPYLVSTTLATLGAVSLGNSVNLRQIMYVAAGSADSDAVNVAQLKAVQALAGTGHRIGIEAASGTATNSIGTDCTTATVSPCVSTIAPGATATYAAGDNVALVQDGSKITLSVSPTPQFSGVTVGNGVGQTTQITPWGVSVANGPSLTTSGINAGGSLISNLKNGSADTDAVTMKQLRDVSTVAGTSIFVQTQATGTGVAHNSSQTLVGVGGTATFVAGNNVEMTQQGTEITIALSDTPSFQSVTANTVSVSAGGPSMTQSGINAANTAITNVAAGLLSATSTEAVNGSQLYATNQAIQSISALAGAGYNVATAATGSGVVHGSTVATIGPAGTATTTAGNNIVLTQNAANLTFAVNDNPNFQSVTVGATSMTASGVAVGATTVNANGVSVASGPSMTAAGFNANHTTITNIAPGVNSTDAVNVEQLESGLGRVNQGLTGLQQQMADGRREANAGTAAAMAMAGMPQAYLPGKSMLAAGAASYNGQTAIAIGLSTISNNGKWVGKFSGSANSRRDVGMAVGLGYQW